MSQTITIPDGVYDAARDVYHNRPVVIGVLVGALLVSLIVELVKRRYTKKQLEKMKSETAQKLLALFAAVFAGLGYLLPFLQTNLDFLRSLPYVGEFAISIYAFANLLYAVRLKVWYKAVAGWLTRESKADTTEAVVVPLTEPQDPVVASSDDLLS